MALPVKKVCDPMPLMSILMCIVNFWEGSPSSVLKESTTLRVDPKLHNQSEQHSFLVFPLLQSPHCQIPEILFGELGNYLE